MAGATAALLPLVLQLMGLALAPGMGRGKSGRLGLGVSRVGPTSGSARSASAAGAGGCLPEAAFGCVRPSEPPESSLLVEEPAWWGSRETRAGVWGPRSGRGFQLWPREEFLQAAVGERLPWNLGV